MDGRLIIRNERIETAETIVSENPASLEPLGEVSLASEVLCETALRAAKEAFSAWRDTSPRERGKIFKRAEAILLQRSAEAGRLITREKGSPYPESLSVEVLGAIEALNFYAGHQEDLVRDRRGRHHVPFLYNKESAFRFHPLGPALVISPWNFPFLIPFLDILSTLTAGNTIVFRPSTTTPLTGLLIGEILVEAGLPPGVLSVVVCRTPLAEQMITHPAVQAVVFTGSVGVGKRLMELASRNLTKLSLELGGKDPMIVLKDADLERAAAGAVWAAFMNCGQSCGSIERVYVAKEIAEKFTDMVLDRTRALKVGNPLDPGIDVGPMANAGQRAVVEAHIRDAQEKGARVLFGGGRIPALKGHFLEPTVLTGVDHSMAIMTEETFGPTLPIMRFDFPEEALELANDSIYGLTASVWTRSRKTASWFADRLETGTVTVNDHMYSFVEPRAIWGGIKQTGMGRSHGPYGLLDLLNIKYVSSDFLRKRSQLWWFPYDEALTRVLENSLVLYHAPGIGKRLGTLPSLLKAWSRIKAASPLSNLIKSLPRIIRK